MNILSLIGRDKELFDRDIAGYENQLQQIMEGSAFLVIGGAGTTHFRSNLFPVISLYAFEVKPEIGKLFLLLVRPPWSVSTVLFGTGFERGVYVFQRSQWWTRSI